VLQGTKFASYRIGYDVYRVGSLSTLIQLRMFFREYPFIIAFSTILLCLLLAVLTRAILRRRARIRLLGAE
jgi:cellulose synthase (UDP-forming)